MYIRLPIRCIYQLRVKTQQTNQSANGKVNTHMPHKHARTLASFRAQGAQIQFLGYLIGKTWRSIELLYSTGLLICLLLFLLVAEPSQIKCLRILCFYLQSLPVERMRRSIIAALGMFLLWFFDFYFVITLRTPNTSHQRS